MDHIQYAKNVLDPFVKEDLKSLLTRHILEVPHYNFMYKGEPPTNFIEKIIPIYDLYLLNKGYNTLFTHSMPRDFGGSTL